MEKDKQSVAIVWIKSRSVPQLLLFAFLWILLFSSLYTFLPLIGLGELRASENEATPKCLLALYVSLVTTVSLGYSDVYPTGFLRLCAGIEVVGGLVFAGLIVNTIVSRP